MEFSVDVEYKDDSYNEHIIEANSLDSVLFSLIGGRSGIATTNVTMIRISPND
jgi:hypothetical protein